ncbi:magnesium transporter [Staphylospora marina]|uniref:magnesium transporter n=1 Tax=Staphylospora marina TaxID=2490858 RepID=UPI0013DE2C32|nr:magnesium transporter [Staphylospora marina]
MKSGDNRQSMKEWAKRLILSEDRRKASEELTGRHPYDLRRMFFELTPDERRRFLDWLEPEVIALILEESEPREQTELLEALGPLKAASVLEHMSRDDVADLLGGMERLEALAFLRHMEKVEADRIRALLRYPEDTAGGLMTDEYVTVRSEHTVEEAIAHLRREARQAETIYYVYVLNERDRLVGVVSLRDLLVANPSDSVKHIMTDRVISVPADMDQEKAAHILGRYDLLALPVIDEDRRLLGIITVDDVIDVLIEEAGEDLERIAAVGKGERWPANALMAAAKRIPWLVLLLLIGTFTANLLGWFEPTIQSLPILTAFMPMIAGMTGNTATQSLALVIRRLSEDSLPEKGYRMLLRREVWTGFWIALVCGLLITGWVVWWKEDVMLGGIIGLSLFTSLFIGTLVGTLVPILLDSFGTDPAVASGPLITTLNDVFSLMIYFGLASLFLYSLS